MDGNGRWAKQRGLPRIEGHRRGVETVRTITFAARDLGVRMLTLYAFSVENWSRPQDEVGALMGLLEFYLKRELETFVRDRVRFRAIGRLEALPAGVQRLLRATAEETREFTNYTLVLALELRLPQRGGRRRPRLCRRRRRRPRKAQRRLLGDLRPIFVHGRHARSGSGYPDLG